MTDEEEAELAQRVLKAGIRPYQLEQYVYQAARLRFIRKGFTKADSDIIWERWGIKAARQLLKSNEMPESRRTEDKS